MNYDNEADDEAQSYEPHIGDVDTAEGQSRRAEEAFFEDLHKEIDEQLEELPTVEEAELGELCRTKTMKEITEELEEDVEELPELPTADEAELGELSKTPEGVECRFCGLPLETLRDNHEEKCPEGLSPTCWDSVDAEQLKMEAEAMGFVVYEGGDI